MKNFAKIILVFGVTLILWWLVALVYNSPALPTPMVVVDNIIADYSGALWVNIGASLLRVGAATALALVIGLPLGLAVGYSKGFSTLASPFIYFSYPVPKLALLPVLMLIFGLGEAPKVLMIFLIIFFPVVLDISGAVAAMDRSLFEMLKSYGLKNSAICLKVVLPGVVPAVLNSLKVTTGIALSVLFFAENYGTVSGMGYYIINSWQKMNYPDLYSGILILSVLGFVIFCLIDLVERRVTRWK